MVYSSKQASGQGPWTISRVNSTTGPSSQLDNALTYAGGKADVEGQTKILWKDPAGRGWKSRTPYRFFLQHRPISGTIRLKIHEGSTELFDTGNLASDGLAGGRVGVFCSSQEDVIWSSLTYKCIQE